jgi:hypothetical protein
MTFLFGLLDVFLTTVLLFDTLGLAYQFRKEGPVDQKEYIRVCFTWILFLSLCSLLSCEKKGFLGTIIRLVFFGVKAFIALPILGGTLKIYKYLIEDGKAELMYNKIKSKVCKTTESGSFKGDSQEFITPQ